MRRLVWLVATLAVAAPGARAHIGSHEIAIRDGYYDPIELHVDPGETVTWNALAQGHTVTADDGRFDFPPDRLTRQGDRFSWMFPTDETFFFHCKVHGSMFGVVVVGEGTPPDHSEDPPEIRRVPEEYATITAAVQGATPGTVIEIAPRSYSEAVRVSVPGLVLRGTGSTPDEVRIEGGSVRGVGITIAADGVTIQNLTVRRTTFAGVFVDGADRARLTDVALSANDRYGVRFAGVRGGVVRRVTATGSQRAGVSVTACVPCDVVVEDSLLERNMAGVEVINGSDVVVRRSVIRENGTGVALKTVLTGAEPPARGAYVHDNTITGNTFVPATRPPLSEELEIPSATGIWVSGAQHALISSNVIAGHTYGVAIAGLSAPALAVRVVGNLVGSSSVADLASDGAGAGICFASNLGDDGEPTSEPPALQTLAPCEPIALGTIPYPVVAARIAARAR